LKLPASTTCGQRQEQEQQRQQQQQQRPCIAWGYQQQQVGKPASTSACCLHMLLGWSCAVQMPMPGMRCQQQGPAALDTAPPAPADAVAAACRAPILLLLLTAHPPGTLHLPLLCDVHHAPLGQCYSHLAYNRHQGTPVGGAYLRQPAARLQCRQAPGQRRWLHTCASAATLQAVIYPYLPSVCCQNVWWVQYSLPAMGPHLAGRFAGSAGGAWGPG
jgi:hypothetical protein